ncbi:hypothetical protein D3C85_1811890 [compost metagenome]
MRRVFSLIADVNNCIRLDFPVPFAPRINSICPLLTVSCRGPVGSSIGIENENDMVVTCDHSKKPV